MHDRTNLNRMPKPQTKPNHLFTKMNPHSFLLDSTSSSLSPLQGLSWHQPQYSMPSMSLEETGQMEKHSNPRLHLEEVAIGSVATAEYGEARNKLKRKGKDLEKRSTCERKRRSRIAERMKTLQELLPNSSYKLSAASVLDKAIEYIKTLQFQKAVLSYQQMMMDGLLIPTHEYFPVRESAWDNPSDSILMANSGGYIPGIHWDTAINPSTHPGPSYNRDGLFSSVTRSMLDSEFLLQLLQSPPMPIPAPLFDGFGGLLSTAASAGPSSQPVSLPVELVSSPLPLDTLF